MDPYVKFKNNFNNKKYFIPTINNKRSTKILRILNLKNNTFFLIDFVHLRSYLQENTDFYTRLGAKRNYNYKNIFVSDICRRDTFVFGYASTKQKQTQVKDLQQQQKIYKKLSG